MYLLSKMEWKKHFSVMLFTAIITATCPQICTGYLQYFSFPRTWLDAHEHCETMGGHLAYGNYTELSKHIPGNQMNAWTGEYKVYVWLWMTGCFDSMSSMVSNISIASEGIPKCFSHCNEGQQDFAIQQDTCFCVPNASIMTERRTANICDSRRFRKCKWGSEETNVRPCGGLQRFSSYTIAKDRVLLPNDINEKKKSRCGSIQYNGSHFTISGSDCNVRRNALCESITEKKLVFNKTIYSNWDDAFNEECKNEFAVAISPNFNENLQRLFEGEADFWVGLVREDITYTTAGVLRDPDECSLATHNGNKQFDSCENKIGYICDIPTSSQDTPFSTVYFVWGAAVLVFVVLTVTVVIYFARVRCSRRHRKLISEPDEKVEVKKHVYYEHNMDEDHYHTVVTPEEKAYKSAGGNKYDHLNQNNFEESVIDDYDLIGKDSENYNQIGPQSSDVNVSYDRIHLIPSTPEDQYDHLSAQNQKTVIISNYDRAHIGPKTDEESYDHISNVQLTKPSDLNNYDRAHIGPKTDEESYDHISNVQLTKPSDINNYDAVDMNQKQK